VDAYNDAILRRIEGRERLYVAADSLKEVNAATSGKFLANLA